MPFYLSWAISLHLSIQIYLTNVHGHCTNGSVWLHIARKALHGCGKPLEGVRPRAWSIAYPFPRELSTVYGHHNSPTHRNKCRIICLPVLLRQCFLTPIHVEIIEGNFEKYWSPGASSRVLIVLGYGTDSGNFWNILVHQRSKQVLIQVV